MGLPSKLFGAQVGKRSHGRLRVQLHAKLSTLGTTHAVILQDISLRGAKLSLENPPKRGTDAVLKWYEYEAFGTIT